MNYLIVDDEPIAHRIIEGYASQLSSLQKVGNAYDAFQATDILSKQPVDLIFLDINMPQVTGFDWLATVSKTPQVIVTTAHVEFALEGYELSVVDYLLKPFSLTRFLKAVNKVVRPTAFQTTSVASLQQPLFLKGDKKHHQVHLSEIQYIEAYGNYCKLYLRDEMILCHEKISSLEALLPSNMFLRVHKSFLVATAKINFIQGNEMHLDTAKIPIGQSYRREVNKLLGK